MNAMDYIKIVIFFFCVALTGGYLRAYASAILFQLKNKEADVRLIGADLWFLAGAWTIFYIL